MTSAELKEQLKRTYPCRIELHAHTKPVSPCSEIPPADLVKSYIDQGFHAYAGAGGSIFTFYSDDFMETVSKTLWK